MHLLQNIANADNLRVDAHAFNVLYPLPLVEGGHQCSCLQSLVSNISLLLIFVAILILLESHLSRHLRMEPISLIGVIDSAIGLAFKCGSVAKRMNDIIKKYRNVELTVLAIVQSLYTIEIAWNQIAVWLKDYASVYSSEDDNFVERLEQSLRGGSLVLDALHREVLPYQVEDARWTFKQRIRIIWTEDSLQEHRSRLRDQASSMTLLLQAIQL